MDRDPQIEDAIAIYAAAVAAVSPARMIELAPLEDWLARPLNEYDDVRVVGAGKGALAMAVALEARLGDRIDAGAVVVPHGYGRSGSANPAYERARRIEVIEAGHPIPDETGVAAVGRLLDLARESGPEDLLIALISGGGSALLAGYVEGISLGDAQVATNLLLRSGAAIHEINAVRKHISRIHGGRLAEAAAAQGANSQSPELLALIVSDVIGDDLSVVSSGPTVPDPSTFEDALAAIDKYNLREKLPGSVREHLERSLNESAAGGVAARVISLETPKPGAACFVRVRNQLIGNNRLALEGAAKEARRRGYDVEIAPQPLLGEARDAGARLAREALELFRGGCLTRPLCRIWGGETTVTVTGGGCGGRNQELALTAAIALDGVRRTDGSLYPIVILSGGTDGVDGVAPVRPDGGVEPPAAGAWASPATAPAARELGLDSLAHLTNNNAYPFFAALNALLLPGPTHTNVMDVQLCLIQPSA